MIKSFIVTRVNLSLPPSIPVPLYEYFAGNLWRFVFEEGNFEFLEEEEGKRIEKMSFMERRGGLTRFKTGFGIVIRVPSPMILSIDGSIVRLIGWSRLATNWGRGAKLIRDSIELMGFSLVIAKCNLFVSLSLSLSCVYIETEFHRRKIVAEKLVFQVLGLLNYRA